MGIVRVFFVFLALKFATSAQAQDADVVAHNGELYTVNQEQTYAAAVAIKDGLFLAVGSEDEIKKHIGDDTDVIDLEGKFVVPGFVDAHTHGLVVVHPLLFALDLDTTDQASLLRSVKEHAEENPDNEWIAGEIWPIGMFPEDAPHRSLLDDIVPDRPVYLLDQSGHSAWLNSKAIEIAGLDDPDLDLDPRAVVVRDESGKATGTIREFAMGYVRRFMSRTPVEEWEETARKMQPIFHGYGFTATRLAGGDLDRLQALRNVEDAGDLALHISVAMDYDRYDSTATKDEQLKAIAKAGEYESDLIGPLGVKIFLDGTQLARQAWNFDAYPGEPDNFGTSYFSQEELTEFVTKATGMNRFVMAHATGDRAVHEFLNAVEAAKDAHPDATIRHHPTHNIQISSKDFNRFAKLGIAAELSPQLIMTPALVDQISDLVGREVLEEGMWRAREIIDAGDTLALASDWSVSDLNPWTAIEYLVTRENQEFPEMGKIAPTSAVTVAEAIRAYTYGSAYAIGKEDSIGTIELGKSADFVVLDRDLLALAEAGRADRISETQVLYTVFQGKVVYENIAATSSAWNRGMWPHAH